MATSFICVLMTLCFAHVSVEGRALMGTNDAGDVLRNLDALDDLKMNDINIVDPGEELRETEETVGVDRKNEDQLLEDLDQLIEELELKAESLRISSPYRATSENAFNKALGSEANKVQPNKPIYNEQSKLSDSDESGPSYLSEFDSNVEMPTNSPSQDGGGSPSLSESESNGRPTLFDPYKYVLLQNIWSILQNQDKSSDESEEFARNFRRPPPTMKKNELNQDARPPPTMRENERDERPPPTMKDIKEWLEQQMYQGTRKNGRPPPTMREDQRPPPTMREERRPPPTMREDRRPPPTMREDRRPPPTMRKDQRPPPTMREDKRPPPTMREDRRPPPTMREDRRPPPTMREDQRPPPTMREDQRPPPTMREDQRPPPTMRKDRRPPPTMREDQRPPPTMREDQRPPPTMRDDNVGARVDTSLSEAEYADKLTKAIILRILNQSLEENSG